MGFEKLLSASAINLYFQCPRRFYYRYILKMPIKDSIHTVRGSLVHSVLEDFYELNPSELTNINYKKVISDKVKLLLDKHWTANKGKLDSLGLSKDKIDFYYDDSTLQLDKWVNKFSGQLEKKLSSVFMIKKAWDYFFPAHRELKIISKKLGLIGYIDQVLHLSDRHLLIDYKTSSSPKLSDDYALQMTVYHMLYKEIYNIAAESYLWFLKFGLKKVPVTESLIVNTTKKIFTVHEAFKSKNILDYQKNVTPLCKWENERGSGCCDFYDQCFSQKRLNET